MMEDRLKEFKQCLIALADLCDIDQQAWKDWISQWTTYTLKGGVRPPTAPPHP